jgi:hypothetical protein
MGALAGGSAQRTQAIRSAVGAWTATDLREAAEWINSLKVGADRDTAAVSLVGALGRSEPETAWSWALLCSLRSSVSRPSIGLFDVAEERSHPRLGDGARRQSPPGGNDSVAPDSPTMNRTTLLKVGCGAIALGIGIAAGSYHTGKLEIPATPKLAGAAPAFATAPGVGSSRTYTGSHGPGRRNRGDQDRERRASLVAPARQCGKGNGCRYARAHLQRRS